MTQLSQNQELLPNVEEAFIENLANLRLLFSAEDPLYSWREKAWQVFIKKGLPKKQDEVFRALRLRDLYSKSYRLAEFEADVKLETKHELCLVFINGRFSEQHSTLSSLPKGCFVTSLSKAIRSYSALLQPWFTRCIQQEKDPFALLNFIFQGNGAYLYIPPKCILEEPIRILNIGKSKESTIPFINPRLHVFAGRHSSVTLIHQEELSSSYWMNQYIDFFLEEGAQVNMNTLCWQDNELGWNLRALRAQLKRDSQFKLVSISNGARVDRQDFDIKLLEENSHVFLHGLVEMSKGKQSHINVLMQHLAPNCTSKQQFKGILNDFSRSSFEGKIYVDPIAQKTQAYQINNNLILNDQASAQSKPNLEILADDVKASHGATIGQLDNDQLFYLESRGIHPADAKNLLIRGFGKEVIDLCHPSLENEVEAHLKFCQ